MKAEGESVPGQRQDVVWLEMSRHVVAKAGELELGASKLVTANGREIGLFNVKGEFFALANRCPHQGGPCARALGGLVLSDGPGEYRWCGPEFPQVPLARMGVRYPYRPVLVRSQVHQGRAFEVTVTPGEELVKGPYVAESFPVQVEDEYLVIEM